MQFASAKVYVGVRKCTHVVNTLVHDVVEAHASALNQTGTLLSDHVARRVNCSETF